MEVNSALRRMVHIGAASHDLRNELRKHGYKTLREEGVLLALDGRTSLEEALRVTKLEDDHAQPEAATKERAA